MEFQENPSTILHLNAPFRKRHDQKKFHLRNQVFKAVLQFTLFNFDYGWFHRCLRLRNQLRLDI